MTQKKLTIESILAKRNQWRENGELVVWTNGCFDLFHVGHLRSLQAAKSLGDRLIVGINSDASIRRLKGAGRPIVRQEERCEIIAALACVDAVVLFEEDTPEASLQLLRPDIHCKGADYAPPNGKPIPERKLVESYGGRVAFIPIISGFSTSSLIETIQGIR
jgi:rfaE bifunctional protein nucleotidyltransferase chain/domain